jgi:hypothetical protein
MAKLLSPDDACVQVDVPFGRGRRYTGRAIEVTDQAHVKALRAAGYTLADAAGGPVRGGGFTCTECGFNTWFKACSRCGGVCERPE